MQNVGVPQLPDDLFGLEPLPGHDLPPSGNGLTATLPLDQFPRARSVVSSSLRGGPQAKERVHLGEPVPGGDALRALRLALPALDAVGRMLLGGKKRR